MDGPYVLKKVAVSGGPPVTLATLDGALLGAAWGPDDTIIFATDNPATGLQRVECEMFLQQFLRTGDHCRVVAEKEPAERRLDPEGDSQCVPTACAFGDCGR